MAELLEKDTDSVLECVAFTVSGQVFCLKIMTIREIRRSVKVTTLPHSGQHVLGVINLRGSVIPVYDMSISLGFGPTEQDHRNVVIIADVEGETFGLLVESVSEILAVDKNDIQELPPTGDGGRSGMLEGLITVGDDMAQLINLQDVSKIREGVVS